VQYNSNGAWVNSNYSMPVSSWQKFTIQVNMNNSTYSAYAGASNEYTLCANVAYSMTSNRLNQMFFSTCAPTGNVTYIDDVLVKWVPDVVFAPAEEYTYLNDDFESTTYGDSIHDAPPFTGKKWQVGPSGSASSFVVNRNLSFGNGYKSLTTTVDNSAYVYSSDTTKLTLNSTYNVTVDFDVYLKTGYKTMVCLRETSSGPITAAVKADTSWKYWNGTSYASTGTGLSYDMWNHVQLVLDCSAKTYKIIVQPVGSMPKVLGTYSWDPGTVAGDQVFFAIHPDGNTGEKVCFDNVVVTYGPR